MHPELIVEFLVHEKGKGTDRPVKIPPLGVNAQALRYLNFLLENTVTAEYEGILAKVPPTRRPMDCIKHLSQGEGKRRTKQPKTGGRLWRC